MKTPPNSVRTIEPVGQASRQPAFSQCLQTSDEKSQRNVLLGSRRRRRAPVSFAALDELHVPPGRGAQAAGVVVRLARHVKPSSGTSFHSLQATSQALQPMQSVESVRKAVTDRIGRRAGGTFDADRRRLRFHDPDVRLLGDRDQVVDDVASDEAAAAEVIRQADLVDDAAVDRERLHARRDERARLDRAARRSRRVTGIAVLDADLAASSGEISAEELRLQLGEMRQRARHAAGGVMLGQPIGREHVRDSARSGERPRRLSGRSFAIRGRIDLLRDTAVRDGDSSGS